MFSNQSAELSFDLPCKSLNAIRGDRLESRFVVGTAALHEPNYLYVVRYHSQVNELGIDGKIRHDGDGSDNGGPIDLICTCPYDKYLLWTSTEQSRYARLFRTPTSIMNVTEELSYDEDDIQNQLRSTFGSQDEQEEVHDGTMLGGSSAATMDQQCIVESPAPIIDVVWKDPALSLQQSEGDDDEFGENYDPNPAASSNAAVSPGDVLTVDRNGNLIQWDIADGGGAKSMRSVPIKNNNDSSSNENSSSRRRGRGGSNGSSGVDTPYRCKWDPHNENAVAVTCGTSIRILDWRVDTSIPSGTVDSFVAHRYGVTDLDYNLNKPYILSSCGQDGILKFWDLRKTATTHTTSKSLPQRQQPLLTARGGHSHWVTSVLYNPFHDQLVLSTGTDSIVNLWRVSTISSAPLLALEDNNGGGGDGTGGVGGTTGGAADPADASDTAAPNVRVAKYEHNDSVYGAAWSAADAWIYATIGYDGKIALNHVPSKEKYKILL